MSSPQYYEYYNAFLESLSGGEIVKLSETKQYIMQKMCLSSEQLCEQSKSGGYIWENRVGWCATYLKNAGLIFKPNGKNGQWQITDSGLSLLAEGITITDRVLERYPSFLAFKNRKKGQNATRNKVVLLEKPNEKIIEAESIADEDLVRSLQIVGALPSSKEFHSNHIPKEKSVPVVIQGRRTYPRHRDTAINALAHANYTCEINPEHPTFLRRNAQFQYTEPHHLVPMCYQDQFDVSLDVEENIISLCCTCHKEIHYGADPGRLVKRLYKARKKELDAVGIHVTLDQLLDMYE